MRGIVGMWRNPTVVGIRNLKGVVNALCLLDYFATISGGETTVKVIVEIEE